MDGGGILTGYTFSLSRVDDSTWMVKIDELPDCYTCASTWDEAYERIIDCLSFYLALQNEEE